MPPRDKQPQDHEDDRKAARESNPHRKNKRTGCGMREFMEAIIVSIICPKTRKVKFDGGLSRTRIGSERSR